MAQLCSVHMQHEGRKTYGFSSPRSQEDCLDAAASLVSACMTDFSDLSGLPMPLSVPLEVRLKVGPSWGQLTNYAPSSRPS